LTEYDQTDPSLSRRHLLTTGAAVGAAALAAGAISESFAQSNPPPLGEFAWGDGIRRIKNAGKVVFGMPGSMVPPQYYRDPKTNEPVGYDAEVARLIAKDLGVEPVFEEAVVAARIIGLQSGKYDIVLAGTANAPVRAAAIAFTRGYVPYEQVLLVRADSPVKTAEELNDPKYTISVQIGATAEYAARQMFPNANIKPLEVQEAMLDVASGRSHADVVERYLAVPFAKNHPNTTLLGGFDKPVITATEFGCVACRMSEMGLRQWLDNWVYWYDSHGVLPGLYQKIMGSTLR
jgi:ABC-type amino acid transport substrate-binding protein